MSLKARLVQKLSQSLLMTPQLQQAIKLLQLGRLDYMEAIEEQLLENPILEALKDDTGDNPESAGSPESKQETEILEFTEQANQQIEINENSATTTEQDYAWDDLLDQYSDYQGSASVKGSQAQEDRQELEVACPKLEDLTQHLIAQLRFADIDDQIKSIACLIIGNLDQNGFLATSEEELKEQSAAEPEHFQRALDYVRSLDPAGVGARDLQHCLSLQLEFAGLGNSLAATIVNKHLDKLEKKKLDVIAKEEKVSISELKTAIESIRKLEPFPGRHFFTETARYITPDVYVQKVQGDFVVTLNEEGLPKLRINPYYLDLIRKEAAESNADKEYLQDRLKAAAWLIKSDLQRRQTIIKVAESIVKFQKSFFEHGISKLKPLVLKEVADDIGMHESTISRITSNKYMHTSQGLFELKFFFTSGIKTSSGDVSASAIKERIKSIITQEATNHPVSDQEIVDLLSKENVSIARRTVAKYRENLGMEPSSQRKRSF